MERFRTHWKKISENLSKDFTKYTKFNPEVRDEDIYRALRKGYWNMALFARRGPNNFGIKIDPKKSYLKWEVAKLLDCNRAITVAPDFKSFLFLYFFDNLKYERVYQLTLDKVEIINEGLTALNEFYPGTDETMHLSSFITKYNFGDFFDSKDIYKKMLSYYFKENAQTYLTIISDVIENEAFFPTLKEVDSLKIFKTRIHHLLAQKAAHRSINGKPVENMDSFLWTSYKDLHSIDVESSNFNFLPDLSVKMEYTIQIIAHLLSSVGNLNDEYNSALMASVLNLNTNEKVAKYRGVEHLEAAALYDIELNKPETAWNCLVNAAYWSGQNAKETYMPAWDAAIFLAEKHAWDDVHEFLVAQKEFYLNFKKKNNIP